MTPKPAEAQAPKAEVKKSAPALTTAAALKKETEVKTILSKTPAYKNAVQETFAKFDGNGNGRIN